MRGIGDFSDLTDTQLAWSVEHSEYVVFMDVRATTPLRALRMHKTHFPALYQELPELIPKLVGILTDRVRESARRETLDQLAVKCASSEIYEAVRVLESTATAAVQNPRAIDLLEGSDREESLSAWLDSIGVEGAWRVAPVFVDAGFDSASLEKSVRGWPSTGSPPRSKWLKCWTK